eukprot:TRINITY_DN7258_c0_g1_i2.p1 TRINITY_DN7258_c0_g1~~TRINITY_DN7258_c0_g1_i2.p1  ORF type:complete len:170 (+),score=6.25 TRINITY_DN7258_c0_g1_i2:52-510(+)
MDANKPSVLGIQSQAPVPWSTGLCDCFDDCQTCCMTWFCPCITFGRIAEIVDRGSTSCAESGAIFLLLQWGVGCGWLYALLYRRKLRKRFNLEESPCNDCLVDFCCTSCALCQEYRQLQSLGFDMAIGWNGNFQKQTRGVTQAPAMEKGMNR